MPNGVHDMDTVEVIDGVCDVVTDGVLVGEPDCVEVHEGAATIVPVALGDRDGVIDGDCVQLPVAVNEGVRVIDSVRVEDREGVDDGEIEMVLDGVMVGDGEGCARAARSDSTRQSDKDTKCTIRRNARCNLWA